MPHWYTTRTGSPRQILGFATGDRSAYYGQMLRESMPTIFQQNAIFYAAARAVHDEMIPADRRWQESGGTAHIESLRRTGFNNTLRQRQLHLTRKTLSFAKSDDSHFGRTLNFINHYNQTRSA